MASNYDQFREGTEKALKIEAGQKPSPMQQAVSNRVSDIAQPSEALPMTNQEYSHQSELADKASSARAKQIAEWAKQGLDENGDPVRKPKPKASPSPSTE